MLPETSSITTRRIGCGPLSNWVSGCGLPSSRTSKLSRVSVVTSRPSRSVTVANTRTASLPARKVGCCPSRSPGVASSDAARTQRQPRLIHQASSVDAGRALRRPRSLAGEQIELRRSCRAGAFPPGRAARRRTACSGVVEHGPSAERRRQAALVRMRLRRPPRARAGARSAREGVEPGRSLDLSECPTFAASRARRRNAKDSS